MEASDKLVSIIVPVHNAGSYISKTINSVKSQTYSDWELILVDDYSSDDTKTKIEAFMQKGNNQIRLIAKKENEGAALARNTGIEAANGRYIAFLDADDIWLPYKLEQEMKFIDKKQAAFVFCSYEFGDEEAIGTGKVVKVPETLTYKQALSRTVIFTSTVLLDTKKTGKDLIHMPNIPSEDSATWWKILRSGLTAYGLNEVLVIYRRPAHSLSSNKVKAIKRIWNLYRNEEHLSIFGSIYNLFLWALRATMRRL